MARRTRAIYPGKRNKGLSSTFQPPEEGRSVQRPQRCNKHGYKDEDNSPKNVNYKIYTWIYFKSWAQCKVSTIPEIILWFVDDS